MPAALRREATSAVDLIRIAAGVPEPSLALLAGVSAASALHVSSLLTLRAVATRWQSIAVVVQVHAPVAFRATVASFSGLFTDTVCHLAFLFSL